MFLSATCVGEFFRHFVCAFNNQCDTCLILYIKWTLDTQGLTKEMKDIDTLDRWILGAGCLQDLYP